MFLPKKSKEKRKYFIKKDFPFLTLSGCHNCEVLLLLSTIKLFLSLYVIQIN